MSLDPRVKRTRKLLQEAFMALMAEKEFQTITIQDITQRAEVNRATFYAHFEDKEALANALLRTMFQEKLDSKLSEAHFSVENLQLLTLAVCEFLVDFTGHCLKPQPPLNLPPIDKQLQLYLYEVLAGWLQESQLPNAESVAMVVSWAILGPALRWSQVRHKPSAQEMADQIFPLLMGGLDGVIRSYSARSRVG